MLLREVKCYSDKEACAFLVEMYSYLASITNITFNATSEKRAIAYDASLYSFGAWEDCKTSGVMFGYASGLFKLIPQVSQFGRRRFREQAEGCGTNAESVESYKDLEAQIRNWQIPMSSTEDNDVILGLQYATYIYQEALMVYLYAGFFATDINSPRFRQMIETSIAKLFPLMESIYRLSSAPSLCSILLWPMIIMGSFLKDPEERQRLLHIWTSSSVNMAIINRATELLDLMWEEESDAVFGPYGLEIIMNRHKINFCMG